jgi:hypothetical protein
MQCLPNSAFRERNPADPATTEADAEPFRVEIQANKRREIICFQMRSFMKPFSFPKQCEILFGKCKVFRRTCACDLVPRSDQNPAAGLLFHIQDPQRGLSRESDVFAGTQVLCALIESDVHPSITREKLSKS